MSYRSKLKFSLFILCCFLLTPLSVLAMSCPNSATIISLGDATEEVLRLCGNPDNINTYDLTTITQQQWDYYISNPNQPNTKVTILFNNDRIENFHVIDGRVLANNNCQASIQVVQDGKQQIVPICNNEKNVSGFAMCNSMLRKNDSINQVLFSCGQPASKITLQTNNTPITEYRYGLGDHNTLVFSNGRLIDWK